MRLAHLVCLGLMACTSVSPETFCTQLGCTDGINLTLKGYLPDSFELTFKAAGQDDRTIRCQQDATSNPCFQNTVYVSNYAPQEVEITYRSSERTFSKSFTPEYTTTKPNGEGCEPSCRQANIELMI